MKTYPSSSQIGALFAIGAAFLFSTKAIFIKQAYALSPLVDGTVLVALRMASALPFFLVIAWLSRHQKKQLQPLDWLILWATGLLGYYFSSWLDFMGLMFISASLERIILFLYPTLTVLASSVLFKQRLTPKMLIALLLSYGGTVIVMLQEQANSPHNEHFWLGASLVFASAVCFAAYLLMTPRLIRQFGSWHFNALALTIACLGTLLHFFVATAQPLQLLAQLPTQTFYYGLMLGFFVTVLPTIFMALSIQRLGPAQSAMIASIGPILTIILATLFLGEYMNAMQWLGCALNIMGVLMITLGKKSTT
ncbi:DMT family transporter [Acinetobacter sp.]|uniref:DMT family transporter n=1 Tax=Acinetobacter sp. TaxID=472 RepID=UPI00389027FE